MPEGGGDNIDLYLYWHFKQVLLPSPAQTRPAPPSLSISRAFALSWSILRSFCQAHKNLSLSLFYKPKRQAVAAQEGSAISAGGGGQVATLSLKIHNIYRLTTTATAAAARTDLPLNAAAGNIDAPLAASRQLG